MVTLIVVNSNICRQQWCTKTLSLCIEFLADLHKFRPYISIKHSILRTLTKNPFLSLFEKHILIHPVLYLTPYEPFLSCLSLTSLRSLEGHCLRGGSFSFTVECSDHQGIVRVWSEITDHLLLLVGSSLYHHGNPLLPSPPASVVTP